MKAQCQHRQQLQLRGQTNAWTKKTRKVSGRSLWGL